MIKRYIWAMTILLVATTMASVIELYDEGYRGECSPMDNCSEQKMYTKVWYYDTEKRDVIGDAGNLWTILEVCGLLTYERAIIHMPTVVFTKGY